MARIGFYPGSFDPVTNGHLDIIARALRLVDRLVIGVGAHHQKSGLLSVEERIALVESEARAIAGSEDAISVVSFDGLAVDAALSADASVIVRGLRNGTDFDYEMQMAGMNATMAPKLETIFLAASPETSFVSSSLVKQIARFNGDIGAFVPPGVAKAIIAKLQS